MTLLTEGQGITRLSAPVGGQEYRVIWSPPCYALVGEKSGLGSVGGDVRWLSETYKRLNDVSWSADGQRIALAVQSGATSAGSASSEDNVSTIYVNESGTLDFKVLVAGKADGVAFVSPVGNQVIVSESAGLGLYQHTLYDLQTQASKSLILGDGSRTTSGRVTWSADGEKVARLMPKHQLYLADLRADEVRHYDCDATEGIGWSPDGKQFYAYDAASGSKILVQQVAGGSTPPITVQLPSGLQGRLNDVRLSPDGQMVAFTVQGLRPKGVCISDLKGGQARQVVPPARVVGWMPGGTSLICVVNADNQEVSYSVNLSER